MTRHATDENRPPARQVLSELDVAALASRITDPERTRVVVVVTSGTRPPADRLDANRIAAEVGPGVEVVTLPTGSLTYALERGLPDDTNVFGDAARTYPVGTAWHSRPHLSVLRFARPDTDAGRLQAQVIADARAAARRATDTTARPPRAGHGLPGAPGRPTPPQASRPVATPAMLPGAPPRRPRPELEATLEAAAAAVPEPPAATSSPAPDRVTGPTPANPHGAPPRPARRTVTASPTATPAAAPPVDRGRLSDTAPWHARSSNDGHALATHLMATRAHPVLVISTPSEDAQPLVDAADLHDRVGEIADVVVLHNGPASWAMADAMPAMTQVYGGAGRVYPIDRGWLANPYRAPIRFCWPGDDPRKVADQLEDDAYAAANLAGLTATRSATATFPATGKVKGPLDRHHVLLWLDRGGNAALLVDQLHPGVEPERLLQPGQTLTGRVERGHMLSPFLPDPIADDPRVRAAAAYTVGDVVLARVSDVTARSGQAQLHPRVDVSIQADADDTDLRNLIAVGDVVTLTLTAADADHFIAELADADAPSVACIPVLPGGPPWLVEEDLPTPAPEPEPESEPQPEPEPEPVAAVPVAASTPPAVTPATVGQHAQVAGLTAEISSLTTLLDRERREAQRLAGDARRTREEAQRLRRQVKSLKDQHQAYRDRVEGARLFSDPERQLRHDIEQTWLRRTPEPERTHHPLADYRLGPTFLDSLVTLEGITRDKVIDVLVEVLTDRARDIPGRELHQLRETESSQVQRVRPDGARAWRCALQVNTPSARRLHFWKLPDATIELDRVGTHDQGL